MQIVRWNLRAPPARGVTMDGGFASNGNLKISGRTAFPYLVSAPPQVLRTPLSGQEPANPAVPSPGNHCGG